MKMPGNLEQELTIVSTNFIPNVQDKNMKVESVNIPDQRGNYRETLES